MLLQERIQNEDMAERWRGEPDCRRRLTSRRRPAPTEPADRRPPSEPLRRGRRSRAGAEADRVRSRCSTRSRRARRRPRRQRDRRRRHLGAGRPTAWRDAVRVVQDHARHGLLLLPVAASTGCPTPTCRAEKASSRTPTIERPPMTRPTADEPEAAEPATGDGRTGVAGGDTRFQVFARLYDTDAQRRHHPQGRPRRRRPPASTVDHRRLPPAPTGTSARPGRCTASTSPATPTCATSTCPASSRAIPLRKDFPLLAREVKPWPGLVDIEPMPGRGRRGRRGGGAGA